VPEYKYPLSNEWRAARQRLAQLEAIWDPWTIRNFEKLQVKEGWCCLEVAGGGGSLAEWLCHRTGNSGRVVATDLQTHFLEALNASNLEVWRHDILSDPLPKQRFDLVHARAVLTFLPQPAEAVTTVGWRRRLNQGVGCCWRSRTTSQQFMILLWSRLRQLFRKKDGMPCSASSNHADMTSDLDATSIMSWRSTA
jgi:hypothetical protein